MEARNIKNMHDERGERGDLRFWAVVTCTVAVAKSHALHVQGKQRNVFYVSETGFIQGFHSRRASNKQIMM